MLRTLDLFLLAVSDRKRVGFPLILFCKNRFGFRSELDKSKKSIVNAYSVVVILVLKMVKSFWISVGDLTVHMEGPVPQEYLT